MGAKSRLTIAILLITLLTLAGCSANGYRNINAEEAKKLIDAGGVKIVDVRTPHEFNEGHIQGAQLIELNQVAAKSASWPKDEKILFVCASGSRSAAAAQMMVEKGYTQVYNLAGGVYQWRYGLVQ